MQQIVLTDRLPAIELGAVVATGLLHVVFQGPATKGMFIAFVSVGWVSYVGWQVWHNPSLWREWGFRTDNLNASLVWPTISFVLAVVAMAVVALSQGYDLWSDHMVVLLLLYPLWGVLQQFLVQALGVLNILKLAPQMSQMFVILIGACLFSVVHYPEGWLMLATWVLGCVFIPCYLQNRNLWVLGLYHGWLGTFFYLWVLSHDPWLDVFGP